MVFSVDKIDSIDFKIIFYIKFKGVSLFRGGTVSPNRHADFETSDKISARPQFDCVNLDKMTVESHFEYGNGNIVCWTIISCMQN